MEQKNHFFFALKLPDSTKLLLKEHCEELKIALPFHRWVHFKDFHITLAFLGFAPTDQLSTAAEKVLKNITGSGPFNMKIDGLGIFGKQDYPRIFFADTKESNELQLVRQKVYSACEEAGFKLEKRPFRPHITLARKWAGEEVFQKEKLDIWRKLQPEPFFFQAEDIVLYQTHLDRTPKYEEVNIFTLENR